LCCMMDFSTGSAMGFRITRLDLPGLLLIEHEPHPDGRGFFTELFRASALEPAGIPRMFPQDNLTRSARNVLRGIHYQLDPASQGKLVCVLGGALFDVAVDLRRGSPCFGRWSAVELRAGDGKILWVPPGFGHAALALEDDTEVLYKVTEEHDPSLDRGILWSDPDLGIRWPVETPVLSERDAAQPLLAQAEINFVYHREEEP
jgi:dTDP-4-dehydrorhamnose 3,5-epimerase